MTEKPQLSRREKKRRIAYRKRRRIVFPVARVTSLLLALLSVILFIIILTFGIVPTKYLIMIASVLVIVNLISFILSFGKKINNKKKTGQLIANIVLSVLMIIGCFKLPAYKSKLERIFNRVPLEQEVVYNVYVLNDDTYDSMKSLENGAIGFQSNMNEEEVEYIVDRFSKDMNTKNLQQKTCHSVIDAVNKLYNGITNAIVLNESSVRILTNYDEYKDFTDKAKVLYTVTRTVALSYETDKVASITKTPFVVGIVGNDEWYLDQLSLTSGFRSDVNMLVAVNPNTHQVLLVSLPRDSYVAVNGDTNRMDKLTHATLGVDGSSGISDWTNTIENLLGFNMNYFVKVNFSSVVKIIDAVGGIDLDNPYAFSTNALAHYDEASDTVQHQHIDFASGMIHLNGEEALAYVRERYSLPDGDLGRNMHQTLVIKAMVNKLVSKEVISRIDSLLDALQGTFVTDMEMKQVLELGRMQLSENPTWEIMNTAMNGYSDYAYSSAVGGELSMLILNEDSVNKASYYIQALLNGERISIGG